MNDDSDYIELEEEQIEVLSGWHHLCPICFALLSIRIMPDSTADERYWYCTKCRTEWGTGDLIRVCNSNELGGSDDY